MQDKAIELLGIDIEKEKQRLNAMSFMLKALKKPKQEESAEHLTETQEGGFPALLCYERKA